MEYLPENKLLKYNDNTLEEVRKMFDLDKPGVMADKVKILEQWVRQQNHFEKMNFDKQYLETTIILCKGSIERAKARLDRACTFRTLVPYLFNVIDVRRLFETSIKVGKHAILPKMTKTNERVFLVRDTGALLGDISVYDNVFSHYILTFPPITEYVRRHDYASSYYAVIDYMDTNIIEVAKNITIKSLHDSTAYILECCGLRLKGVYLISSSKLIGTMVTLFKQVLSAKLGDRIHVLKDRESLQNLLDKDILPKEYGGNEKSLDELHEEWLDVIDSEDHKQYLKEIYSARTDESKRQSAKFNEEYLGMPGSFRKLNVD